MVSVLSQWCPSFCIPNLGDLAKANDLLTPCNLCIDLNTMQTSTATEQSTINEEARLTRDTDIESYQGELENLAKEVGLLV